MSVNYREPQWLLPNEKNLQYPAAGATQGSGLTADRHSLYSMDFDGTAEKISFTSSVNLGESASISLWAKFDSFGSVLIGESSYNSGYLLYIDSSNIYAFGGSGPWSHSMSTGIWYNLVIVKTGNSVEIFQNNSSLGTNSSSADVKFDTLGHKPAGASGGSRENSARL